MTLARQLDEARTGIWPETNLLLSIEIARSPIRCLTNVGTRIAGRIWRTSMSSVI